MSPPITGWPLTTQHMGCITWEQQSLKIFACSPCVYITTCMQNITTHYLWSDMCFLKRKPSLDMRVCKYPHIKSQTTHCGGQFKKGNRADTNAKLWAWSRLHSVWIGHFVSRLCVKNHLWHWARLWEGADALSFVAPTSLEGNACLHLTHCFDLTAYSFRSLLEPRKHVSR